MILWPIRGEADGGSALKDLAPSTTGWSAGTSFSHTMEADLRNSGTGSVDINRYLVSTGWASPGGRGGFFSVNGVAERSDYNWTGEEVFDATNRLALSGIGVKRFGESRWGLFGFGRVAWTAEDGSSLGRGFSSTAVFGPAYSFTPRFTLTAGFLVNVQPERSTRVFPVAGLNWRINENWAIRTLNGVIVNWRPDGHERWGFDFLAEYRTRGIRLGRYESDNEIFTRPAVDEREIALGVSASWQVTDRLLLGGFAEYLFAREWQIRAKSQTVGVLEAENAARLGLRVDYLF